MTDVRRPEDPPRFNGPKLPMKGGPIIGKDGTVRGWIVRQTYATRELRETVWRD